MRAMSPTAATCTAGGSSCTRGRRSGINESWSRSVVTGILLRLVAWEILLVQADRLHLLSREARHGEQCAHVDRRKLRLVKRGGGRLGHPHRDAEALAAGRQQVVARRRSTPSLTNAQILTCKRVKRIPNPGAPGIRILLMARTFPRGGSADRRRPVGQSPTGSPLPRGAPRAPAPPFGLRGVPLPRGAPRAPAPPFGLRGCHSLAARLARRHRPSGSAHAAGIGPGPRRLSSRAQDGRVR